MSVGIYDLIVSIETTVQDAQHAVAKTPGIDATDMRFTQIRAELDGLWNAMKVIGREIDRRSSNGAE
ncbi:MAG TPA: hypothetical protein VFQ54_00520 [Thermomicrobiales bacterium]|nr:hypothetical protein [Thermomicrobiales bacterium]